MGNIKYDAAQVASVFESYPKEEAIIVTSDGNVFLKANENYAASHCKEFKQTHEELTRVEFEKSHKVEKTIKATESTSKEWMDGKFADIVEFAASKGLVVTTRKNQGTKVLIAEVEKFLAAEEAKEVATAEALKLAEGSKEGSDESDEDYTPVGTAGADSPQA